MRVEEKPVRPLFVVWAVLVGSILVLSAAMLQAQGDGPVRDLTLDELQEQREILAAEAAATAASIDVVNADVEEIEQALEEMATLANLHQTRLDDATDRYESAIGRVNQAALEHEEVSEAIESLRVFVSELAVTAFTGEANADEFELALSSQPGEAARFLHILGLQFGDVEDSLDRLQLLQIQGQELLVERDEASLRAEEELVEVRSRAGELTAAIAAQEALLRSAESRLAAEVSAANSLDEKAEELALLLAEEERRLEEAVRGIGSPAPVNREDIVLLTFFEGDSSAPVFRIQVHKDIEEQTRGLYELAFSQGINLGGWGYRTTDRQIELRESHCGSSSYDIWLKPAGQCSPPTARPGFSKHEQGRAIDFQWNGGPIGSRSGQAFQWLAANAPQFGFVNLPSEPWHWSDGSGITFDPSVPVPEVPEDAFLEAEPDAETAELLSELPDLGADVEGEPTADGLAEDEAVDTEVEQPDSNEEEGETATEDPGDAEAVGAQQEPPAPVGAETVAGDVAPEGNEVQDVPIEASSPDDTTAEATSADGTNEVQATVEAG